MELSDLQVFRTVAEEGGISAAAQKLHRVPSNITARIKKLEEELGQQLFVRDRNRLKISSTGVQLLTYAERILGLAEQALLDITERTPNGRLVVGSMEGVAATRLAGWLSDYHGQHQAVQLQLKSAPTGDLIDAVLCGDIDIAFVADPPNDERLVSKPIVTENLVLVSDLQQKTIKHPSDLVQRPTVLGFNARCAYRKRLESWLAQSDVAIQVIEIPSYHTLLSCVAAGIGVGLVTQSLLDLYASPNALKAHRLPSKWSKTTTHLIWRPENGMPSLMAFVGVVTGMGGQVPN